jgi:transposase
VAKLQPDSYVSFVNTNTRERAATMFLREILTRQWWRFQDDLFPAAEEDLGPLSEKHRALIVVLETVCVERFLPYAHGLVGRPLAERTALARAFIVKAVFNIPTTRLLIDLLQGDIRLRRLCGWERRTDIPSEATFSRGYAEFAKQQLPARIHEALIKATLGQTLVGHIARDGTAIEAREQPVRPEKKAKLQRKRGRRRKGEPEPLPDPSRIEQQKNMTLAEMLADLPKACTFGCKRNAKGHQESWIGYKLHVDTADGDIPVSAILTSASPHDSQVAIPLATMTAQRVINLYDLMDSAYDNDGIRGYSIEMGHVPIIDINPRADAALKADIERENKAKNKINFQTAEDVRYNQRSSAERVNSNLKDNFGGRHVRVRGHAKIYTHLMFGLLSISALQLMRLVT